MELKSVLFLMLENSESNSQKENEKKKTKKKNKKRMSHNTDFVGKIKINLRDPQYNEYWKGHRYEPAYPRHLLWLK